MNYDELATQESIDKTAASLKAQGIDVEVLDNKTAALARIKELIPAQASVMNGSSRTLEEIGFVEYLKSDQHPWKNLHEDVLAENDPVKRAILRKQAVLSDYYLGSLHAISETGQIVVASNSGSQLPHLAYTSPNIILVAGIQKIMPTFDRAMERLEQYVLPLENERMMTSAGRPSAISKLLVIRRESPTSGRRFKVLFVKEKLGF